MEKRYDRVSVDYEGHALRYAWVYSDRGFGHIEKLERQIHLNKWERVIGPFAWDR